VRLSSRLPTARPAANARMVNNRMLISGVAPFAGVEYVEGVRLHLREDRHLHRQVGFDDCGEPMLAVDQYSVVVEGDALVGDLPVAAAHRLGERAHRGFRQWPVAGVGCQHLLGLVRRDLRDPAAHSHS
jgi:hypothetical protein